MNTKLKKIAGQQLQLLRLEKNLTQEPVSYTHLDVYKRQLDICVKASEDSMFPFTLTSERVFFLDTVTLLV